MKRIAYATRFFAGLLTIAGAAVTPALAHHPMGGALPSNFVEGLLSGIGHPVIGPDHLAFLVAMGIAAALIRSGAALIGAFIAASMTGVLVHVAQLDVPMIEFATAASVIVAGVAIAARRGLGQPGWLVLGGSAGLLHGYALAEAIIGAEQTVIGAYLLGVAIVASGLMMLTMLIARRVLTASDAAADRRQAVGGVLGVVGLALLATSLMTVQ